MTGALVWNIGMHHMETTWHWVWTIDWRMIPFVLSVKEQTKLRGDTLVLIVYTGSVA